MRNYSKSFVDLQDCTYNPLIIPFLSEEEKVLLDNGDLVFLEDEDEEDKVQKQVEEKYCRVRRKWASQKRLFRWSFFNSKTAAR